MSHLLQCDAIASFSEPTNPMSPAPGRFPCGAQCSLFPSTGEDVLCTPGGVTGGNPSKGRPILRPNHPTASVGRLEVVEMGCGD